MNDGSPHPRQSDIVTRGRVSALPTADRRRPLIMVLGMHRTGTSLCSHMLSLLGVDMADKVAGPGHAVPASDNPQGHWERWEIVAFHDRILQLFDREVYGAFHDFALPAAWWADPEVAKIRREIVDFTSNRIGEAPFGFKDPRTVRLMPLWYQIAAELDLAPRLVLCMRSPAQAARSLSRRDDLPLEMGEYRWLVHMIDFFRYLGDRAFCGVEYDTWFTDPAANVDKLRAFLGLEWQQSRFDLDLAVAGIVNPELRHDDRNLPTARQPLVRSLYQLVGRAEREPAAREQIRQIVAQFIGFQQLQLPFVRAYEATEAKLEEFKARAAKLEAERDAIAAALEGAEKRTEALTNDDLQARLMSLEAERNGAATAIADLRRALADRVAAVAEAQSRAEAAESQLAQALVETDELRTRRQDVEREREAQLAASAAAQPTAAGLSDRLTAGEAALAAANAAGPGWQIKAEEADARLDAALIAAEALRHRLAAIEREQADEAAVLADLQESEADLLAAIESGRAALVRAAAEAAEAREKLAQALTEKDALAASLASAEREHEELRANAACAEATVTDLQARLTYHETARKDAEEQLARAIDLHTSALAEAEQQRQQERSAVDNEISWLRDAFATAQQQADRRGASIGVMLREISTLRQNISAARSVSAVLVSAFRDNTSQPVVHHDSGPRWLPPWLRRRWFGSAAEL